MDKFDLVLSKLNDIEKQLSVIYSLLATSSNQQLKAFLETPNENLSNNFLILDKYPKAVETDFLPNKNVLFESLITESLIGKKFLEYGCKDGSNVEVASSKGARLSVGYDSMFNANWERLLKNPNILLTTDNTTLGLQRPYDVILMNDVLDHLQTQEIIPTLKNAKYLLEKNGNLYIRFHPWTSRNAIHQGVSLNKAYLHLILSDKELKSLIEDTNDIKPCVKLIDPIKTYEDWINAVGLKIKSKQVIKQKVEDFYKDPSISSRMMKNLQCDIFPEQLLEIQFVDYILSV